MRGPALAVAPGDLRGALHDLGLLVDFLEHEVTVFALVSGFGAFMVLHYFTLDRHTVDIPDLHAVTTDLGNIAFFQVHETVGHLTQRQLVRGQEVFTRPMPITSGLPLRAASRRSGCAALMTASP